MILFGSQTKFGDRKETKVSDDNFTVGSIIENILSLEIFMNNSSGMKITHPLTNLLNNQKRSSPGIKLCLVDVKMSVKE